MKTKAICSFFVLFAIVAVMVSSTPAAFAEVTIIPATGSAIPTADCIEIEYGCYIPGMVTVDVGEKVIFSNTDSASHTFTAGTAADGLLTDAFGMDLLPPGNSFEWSPDITGEFPYFCMIHPWMDGLIIVQEAAAEEEVMEEEVIEEIMEEEVIEEIMEEEVIEEIMEEELMVEEVVEEGGGCLIATATFGSEMAPQVQQLRELRDNTILSTESGTAFMSGFNQIYYSFSPMISDLERESPVFKEAVKLTLTPMLSSLSLLNYVDINSEEEMLGYGISLILLNIGMYAGIPAFGILKLYQFRKN